VLGPDPGSLDRVVGLPDGRRVVYADLGDPAGYPVLSCHGGLTCRLDVVTAHAAARRAGVRIVSPDRPGVGRSARRPGRTVADWVADASAVADRLGLEHFSVLGWSMGGPYALACAALLPDRVRVAVVVAGGVPLDWPCAGGTFPDRLDARLLQLARERPGTAELVVAASRGLAQDPAGWLAGARRTMPPVDVAAIERVGVELFTRAVAEGLADPGGVVDEYLAYDAPWGFRHEDVGRPVRLWQGSADTVVPPSWSEAAAARLPRAELRVVEGAGHLVALDHWEAVLDDLVADPGGPPQGSGGG
jgi:pimeloyl-ACP methyl ester carboxylesterase